jgi:parallel beta-helix repeat protein
MEVTESEDITILGNEIYDNGVHGVFLNSTDSHNITDNYIHDNGGSGVVVDPSNKGSISENLIYRNSEYGIFLLNSGNTDINNNVIVNNELYGIKISSDSNDNTISYNDFIGNNLGGTSQAYDDGLNNLFTNNYFIDHDNTDKNNDGIADTSYPIDGSEENVDSSPSASPIQPLGELDLEIEELVAYIEFYPEVLNLKSKDQWVTVYITLPEGYSATNIDVSTIHIDGDIYAESAKVKDSRTLKVKFDRQELISYLESLDLNLPSEVNINITGLLNGHLVRFNGVVQITVFKKGGKQLSGFTIVILFWAMIAIVLRRRIFKKSTPINSI